MKTDQSIAIMKALGDRSRLAIVNSLLERSQYVEEIASRHGLAPSTVSFHLRKLEQSGLVSSRKEQYYVVFRANDEIFDTTLREIVSVHPVGKELQDERMEQYRHKVLASFFRHGRLEKLPAQQKKRLIVLEQFALRFETGRRYSEPEVTGLIRPVFDDYCTIRRLLVDEGLIKRDDTGYWREEGVGDAANRLSLPSAGGGAAAPKKRETSRSEIKRLYKQNRPDMGIYQIRNTVNGKVYVGSSQNLEGTKNSRMFQLRMGKVVFSRELQSDLNEFGAANFEFSVLGVLEPPGPGETIEHALTALELHWLEKLMPFGEKGYNSVKAYQREKEKLGPR
jgi:DNA-binding transcriptional regulator YhcF (GntR family)